MWKVTELNSNCIKGETSSAYLIQIPKTEWRVWISKKLARLSGRNDYILSISYKDDMEFKIFKNGKGKYNKFDKVDEDILYCEDFIEMLGGVNELPKKKENTLDDRFEIIEDLKDVI